MEPITKLLILIPTIFGVYFNAVLISWFAACFKKHGLIFSPRKSFAVAKPLFYIILIGCIPGMVITNFIYYVFPSLAALALIPFVIGILISSILLHKNLFEMISDKVKWNRAIIIIALLQIALFIFVIFSSPT